MTDPSALISVGTSLKTAVDLTKSLLDLARRAPSSSNVADEIVEALNAKVRELQAEVLTAQQFALTAQAAQFSLTNRIRELEEQLMQHEGWAAERERYTLHEVRPGAFAYVLKPGVQSSQPEHWLCPTCFEQQRKSVLQAVQFRNRPQWFCVVCNTMLSS